MVVRTRLTRLPNKDAFENERVATWKAIYVYEARGRVIHVIDSTGCWVSFSHEFFLFFLDDDVDLTTRDYRYKTPSQDEETIACGNFKLAPHALNWRRGDC